jgi:phosphoglycolate phosphatase-like HAD superfamily hydrolase
VDIKTAAFRCLYAPHGEGVVARVVDYHRANGGVSRRQKIRYCHQEILGKTLGHEGLESLCRQFSALVEDAVVNAPMVAGAARFLETASRSASLFVISGTPHEELARIVERRGLSSFFTAVYGSPPEKVPIIQTILAERSLPPESVMFVGDSMTDYRAAQATKVDFVGRVAPGEADPFPPGTMVVGDLRALVTKRLMVDE